MSDKYSNNSSESFNRNFLLSQFLEILTRTKWVTISLTSSITIAGVIYSLLLPNIYESSAVLNPTNSSSSIGRSLRSFSGLASIAGVGISSEDSNSNTTQALEKLKSLSFFRESILPDIYLPDLMAFKSWEVETNTLKYDENIFQHDSNKWVRKYAYPQKKIPSAQESFKVFRAQHFSYNEDSKTGFITIKIKHQSPFIAKQWAELFIDRVNAYYRKKDRYESEKAVNFLNEQILKTNLSEVKESISDLLKEETKKLALIEANEYYVFEYIDPPAAMEIKSEPKRTLICILSMLLGIIASALYVLIRYFFSDNNSQV